MTESNELHAHLAELRCALDGLARRAEELDEWSAHLVALLGHGGRLLVAGNGGSAAEAQHLTSELVGRFRDDREPLSAIALHAETSSLSAIANDFGVEEMFARQVQAHGRPGDVLLSLSTSGRSTNLLHAVKRAHECGLTTWALTGRAPNPLADLCDRAIIVDADDTTTIQEVHLVAVHELSAGIDRRLAQREMSVT